MTVEPVFSLGSICAASGHRRCPISRTNDPSLARAAAFRVLQRVDDQRRDRGEPLTGPYCEGVALLAAARTLLRELDVVPRARDGGADSGHAVISALAIACFDGAQDRFQLCVRQARTQKRRGGAPITIEEPPLTLPNVPAVGG